MAKPIIIIKIPNSHTSDMVNEIRAVILSREELHTQYHVFLLPNISEEYEVKVFNGKYSDSEYMKLEHMIDELKKEHKISYD
jgi:hypothetical protein